LAILSSDFVFSSASVADSEKIRFAYVVVALLLGFTFFTLIPFFKAVIVRAKEAIGNPQVDHTNNSPPNISILMSPTRTTPGHALKHERL
jgi:hypothetical protein